MFPESPKKSRHSLNNLRDLEVRTFIANARKTGVYGKKLFDGGGLFLKVSPAGTALWLLKYELGTEKTISFGQYPTVTLEEARRKRTEAKALIDEGTDPVKARRVRRLTHIATDNATFAHAFEGWLAIRQKEWSGIHFKNSSRAFERDVLPAIGKLPVAQVTSAMVLDVIKAIEGRGVLDTAKKVHQHLGGIFDYAIVMGLAAEWRKGALSVMARGSRQTG